MSTGCSAEAPSTHPAAAAAWPRRQRWQGPRPSRWQPPAPHAAWAEQGGGRGGLMTRARRGQGRAEHSLCPVGTAAAWESFPMQRARAFRCVPPTHQVINPPHLAAAAAPRTAGLAALPRAAAAAGRVGAWQERAVGCRRRCSRDRRWLRVAADAGRGRGWRERVAAAAPPRPRDQHLCILGKLVAATSRGHPSRRRCAARRAAPALAAARRRASVCRRPLAPPRLGATIRGGRRAAGAAAGAAATLGCGVALVVLFQQRRHDARHKGLHLQGLAGPLQRRRKRRQHQRQQPHQTGPAGEGKGGGAGGARLRDGEGRRRLQRQRGCRRWHCRHPVRAPQLPPSTPPPFLLRQPHPPACSPRSRPAGWPTTPARALGCAGPASPLRRRSPCVAAHRPTHLSKACGSLEARLSTPTTRCCTYMGAAAMERAPPSYSSRQSAKWGPLHGGGRASVMAAWAMAVVCSACRSPKLRGPLRPAVRKQAPAGQPPAADATPYSLFLEIVGYHGVALHLRCIVCGGAADRVRRLRQGEGSAPGFQEIKEEVAAARSLHCRRTPACVYLPALSFPAGHTAPPGRPASPCTAAQHRQHRVPSAQRSAAWGGTARTSGCTTAPPCSVI